MLYDVELTPCISAPLLEPLTRATVPSMFTSDLCRFTSCVVPKDEEAGRFSPDMLTDFVGIFGGLGTQSHGTSRC